MTKHIGPAIAAAILIAALTLSVATAFGQAGAAGTSKCEDSKGSTLALHSRRTCQAAAREARRVFPKHFTRVNVVCSTDDVTSSESTCTWKIRAKRFKNGRYTTRCHGQSAVTGRAHVRINPRPSC